MSATIAVAKLVWGAAVEAARTTTLMLFEIGGAVKLPMASTVPRLALPPGTSFTDQATLPLPVDVAVKRIVWALDSAAYCGPIVTDPICCGVGGDCDGVMGTGGGAELPHPVAQTLTKKI